MLRDELGGDKNLTALMGKAKSSERLKKFPITIDTINEVIVIYANFSLALAEKARVFFFTSISRFTC